MSYITLPLKDGSNYDVPFKDSEHYEEMFPNINVAQEFCSMLIWLECNPSRQKTRRGIKRFIAHWLISATIRQSTPLQVQREAQVGRR